MTAASWYSQRFRPDGGITADGLRNQLGRPSLSRLRLSLGAMRAGIAGDFEGHRRFLA